MVDPVDVLKERDPLWVDLNLYLNSAFPYLDEVLRWQHTGYDFREWFWLGDEFDPPSELPLGMDEAETVGDHVNECVFWAVNLHTRLNYPNFIDKDKVVAMLYIHDAGEVHAGEIPVFQGKPEGFKQNERMGFVQLLCETECFSERLLALYDEYENEESLEALFAKFVDRYQGNLYFYQHQKSFSQSMLDRSKKRIEDVYQKISLKVMQIDLKKEVRDEFLGHLGKIVGELNAQPYLTNTVIT